MADFTPLFRRPDQVQAPLHVVTSVFNPVRYKSRWRLYQDFEKHVREAGAILYTAEVAYGEREFSVTDFANPRHLQLRTCSEIWLKENALNLVIQRLPRDWRYVAWIDADVMFARPDWASETIQQLQHHDVVQMWSEAHDLGPDYQLLMLQKSFAYCRAHNLPNGEIGNGHYYYAGRKGEVIYRHPGYAWAFTRRAYDALGGFLDFCIVGSADYHMANALIGSVGETIRAAAQPSYNRRIMEWERRAETHIRRNVGYVPGLLLHQWHGPKQTRRYIDRWQMLIEEKFDPDVDLIRDWQGLYYLREGAISLRDRLRAYFRQRNEDSNYVADFPASTPHMWRRGMQL